MSAIHTPKGNFDAPVGVAGGVWPIAGDPVDAERLLRSFVEICPTGAVVSEPLGRVVLANRKAEEMFGYAAGEMIDQSVDILVPARSRPRHVRHRAAYSANPRPIAGAGRRLLACRKDGSEFLIELGITPVALGEGSLVLSSMVDVSDRDAVERRKQDFSASISHELRTPLTSIAGALALLMDEAKLFPDSAARLLAIAFANSQRLASVVNGIVTMEKIESGRVLFVLKRVSALEAAGKALNASQEFADVYSVRLKLHAPAETADVKADVDWLVTLFTNLISNAIKFSPAGSAVDIEILDRGDSVRFSIRDYGPGVSDEFKPHLFDTFSHADASDARKQGGVGLGLSIVGRIVNRLHGTILVEDAPGGGAVFHVDLPACGPGNPPAQGHGAARGSSGGGVG